MHIRRRPSASLAISLVALFVALGGVGWAATQLPAGSVGTAQLQAGAVSNSKIQNQAVGNWKLAFGAVGARKLSNGAVGKGQINSNQVQARISSACASGAIASVSAAGGVTCAATLPQEFDTASASPVPVPAGTIPTTIASESLLGGSPYLVLANPYVQITHASSAQQVQVSCTLAVGPTAAAVQTREWTVEIGSGGDDQANSIPLVVTAPQSANSITANVTCTRSVTGGTGSPTVTVSSNVNALQTASNTTTTPSSSSSG
jgi:hypothetical protein